MNFFKFFFFSIVDFLIFLIHFYYILKTLLHLKLLNFKKILKNLFMTNSLLKKILTLILTSFNFFNKIIFKFLKYLIPFISQFLYFLGYTILFFLYFLSYKIYIYNLKFKKLMLHNLKFYLPNSIFIIIKIFINILYLLIINFIFIIYISLFFRVFILYLYPIYHFTGATLVSWIIGLTIIYFSFFFRKLYNYIIDNYEYISFLYFNTWLCCYWKSHYWLGATWYDIIVHQKSIFDTYETMTVYNWF